MSIDFEGLAASLLARAESLLPSWLPEGKRVGREYTVGSLNGERGSSLSINLDTGIWKDFAGTDSGADLISLYAALNGIKQGDAVKALFGDEAVKPVARRAPVVIEPPAIAAPADTPPPAPHYRHGEASAAYCYRDATGAQLGWVCRYETAEGKVFAQYRWLDGGWQAGWQAKALPKPRPLYNLDKLAVAGDLRVMVVEGEKAADAVATLGFKQPATCWLGGAQAFKYADWEPLRGRKVDLWPDNDEPGRNAMVEIAKLLWTKFDCKDIRFINPDGQPDKWDVADALADGWSLDKTRKWILREDKRFLVPFTVSAPEPDAEPPFPLNEQPSLTSSPASGADLPIARDIYGILPPGNASLYQSEIWQRLKIPPFEGSSPPCNESTAMQILSHCPGLFWFDDFTGKSMTRMGGEEREFSPDADPVEILVWMQTAARLPKMRESQVSRAIEYIIYHNRRNSAQEWLQSLKWDGIDRLQHMLHEAFGTAPDAYHQQVGRNFIMQMVHRIMEPGCKADYVPIFEGGQGIGKTTMMEVIGGDWFAALSADFSSKDFLQDIQGKMLLELPELSNLNKSDAETVKAIISRRVDRFRKSYGRASGDYPRMCVFAGTTNADDWNRDETGARRFWRVICGKMDPQWIVDNRDQLFAEAAHRVAAGEQHWQVDQERALELQQTAMLRDTWHESVMGYCAGRTHVRIDDILTNCLQIEIGRQDRVSAKRIAAILRTENWIRASVREHGRVISAYKKPSSYTVDRLNEINDTGVSREMEGF